MDIEKHLIRFNDSSLPENFVAIAAKIESQEVMHAAILIRHNSIDYLHHFPGKIPPIVEENFIENGWGIYKIIDIVNVHDPDEVGSFLQYCRRICKKSNITYSYIADCSSHANDGEFISRIGLPEFGTCVGFCLNTLANTIIDLEGTILHLDDWDDTGLDQWIDDWAVKQAEKKYPDLDWNIYNAFKKRITPLEYLCAGFINEFPIRKAKINELKVPVQDAINQKFT
jgi:hypothetical protein